MRTSARLLIALLVIYAVGFPVAVAYIKARKAIFPADYRPIVYRTALRHGLDPLLVAALIHTESGYDRGAVSRSGAVGLMQIMPDTALELAQKRGMLSFSREQLYRPEINLDLGCFMLSRLIEEYRQIELVLVAYNAGRGNLQRWMTRGNLMRHAYPETRNYVIKVTRTYRLLRVLHYIERFF